MTFNHDPDYDIIVIGAGPAGANFARLVAATEARILVIDGSDGHDKVCGGLLSPDAQYTLARYDIPLPRDVLVNPQLFSVRTVDLGTGLTRYYRRSYLNVDRKRLDDFFRAQIPATVELRSGRCEEICRTADGFALKVCGKSLTCRYLVGADGASSIVRRSLFGQKKITSSGCSWIFFKDGALIFGGAFDTHGARAAFESQKRKLITHGLVSEQVLNTPIRTEACTVFRPRPGQGPYHGENGCFLIGEAAGFISPSSFEGISYALRSGEALADAFIKHEKTKAILRAYRRNTKDLTRKITLRYLKRPFMYHPLLRHVVLHSGISALHIKEN